MDVEEIHFTGFDPIVQIGSRCVKLLKLYLSHVM